MRAKIRPVIPSRRSGSG